MATSTAPASKLHVSHPGTDRPDSDRPLSEAERGTMTLADHTDSLLAIIDVLDAKLNKVLRPSNPEAPLERDPVEMHTTLGKFLHSEDGKVMRALRHIDNIIDRLEV